jgi:hypothetical protein
VGKRRIGQISGSVAVSSNESGLLITPELPHDGRLSDGKVVVRGVIDD